MKVPRARCRLARSSPRLGMARLRGVAPLLVVGAVLSILPQTALWADDDKEATYAAMKSIATQIESLKDAPGTEAARSELLVEYRGLSAQMGGDDPARLLGRQTGAAAYTPRRSRPDGGGSGCATAPFTFTQSTPTAIPTGPAVVTSTLVVSGAGTFLNDMTLTTFITHTFAADLDITIQSPAGTVVTLTTDNGAGNDNVYNGTVWDDKANPGGQVPY